MYVFGRFSLKKRKSDLGPFWPLTHPPTTGVTDFCCPPLGYGLGLESRSSPPPPSRPAGAWNEPRKQAEPGYAHIPGPGRGPRPRPRPPGPIPAPLATPHACKPLRGGTEADAEAEPIIPARNPDASIFNAVVLQKLRAFHTIIS
jgi:hypothetical protein